jgi:replication initiation and membrane attachment protein DnaB
MFLNTYLNQKINEMLPLVQYELLKYRKDGKESKFKDLTHVFRSVFAVSFEMDEACSDN